MLSFIAAFPSLRPVHREICPFSLNDIEEKLFGINDEKVNLSTPQYKQYSLSDIVPKISRCGRGQMWSKIRSKQWQTICETLSHFPQVNHYSISRKYCVLHPETCFLTRFQVYCQSFERIVRAGGNRFRGQLEASKSIDLKHTFMLKEIFPPSCYCCLLACFSIERYENDFLKELGKTLIIFIHAF